MRGSRGLSVFRAKLAEQPQPVQRRSGRHDDDEVIHSAAILDPSSSPRLEGERIRSECWLRLRVS